MILTKYLVNIILKHQIVVLIMLFLVFVSQRFIQLLNLVVNGDIPKFLIFVFFALSIPEVMKLILPISLFFGVLITFNYLRLKNEIVGMYSCGIGNSFIIRGVLLLTSVTLIISLFNVFFLSPLCLRYQNQLLLKYQSDLGMIKLFSRQFQFVKHLHSVFFIDSFYGRKFEGIFFIQMMPNGYCSVVVSDHGCIERSFDGAQWLILNSGSCYFWDWDKTCVLYPSFYINDFDRNQILISQNPHYSKMYSSDLVTEMFVNRLLSMSTLEARIELCWRLTLIFVVFVMVLIVFPLSLMRSNDSYFLNVCISIVLYLLFFFLQVFLRFYVAKGYVNLIWIWIINVFYVLIAVVLNFWNSVFFRSLCWKLKLVYMNRWD